VEGKTVKNYKNVPYVSEIIPLQLVAYFTLLHFYSLKALPSNINNQPVDECC